MVAEGGEGENPLPFPPGPHLRSSRFSRHPRLCQALRKNRNLRGGEKARPLVGRAPSPGNPGPKPPGDLAHRPLGPGSRHSHGDFLQAKFLTSCCSGSQNATRTPSPLTLGGLGWFPKAELYSSMRGGVPSSLQHFSRWDRLMKSLACCTD